MSSSITTDKPKEAGASLEKRDVKAKKRPSSSGEGPKEVYKESKENNNKISRISKNNGKKGKNANNHHQRRGKRRRCQNYWKKRGRLNNVDNKGQRSRQQDVLKKPEAAAPRNTTQFIMNDHSDTIQYLDHKLGVRNDNSTTTSPSKANLNFQSAFENSEDNSRFLTTENEEEFLNKEFLKDYNSAKAERLVSMSKSELISEYLQMESRVDSLEKKLSKIKQRHIARTQEEGTLPESLTKTSDVSEKIRLFHDEIRKLEIENEKLRGDCLRLRKKKGMAGDELLDDNLSTCSSSYCSTCSGSESSDSSSSCSSSEDESESKEQEAVNHVEVRSADGQSPETEEPVPGPSCDNEASTEVEEADGVSSTS